MTNEIDQGLYEKLCAFVLGEASDDVRLEVEKALEGSAELRAERERLERTIGFVKEAMSGSEALPPSAAIEILADARRPRQRPWYAQPSFRIAAGLAAVAIAGLVAFRAMQAQRTRAGVELAQLSKSLNERGRMQPAPEKAEADAKEDLGLLAYSEQKTPASAPSSSEPPTVVDATGSTYRGPGDAVPAAGADLTVASLDRIDAMGEQQDAGVKNEAPDLTAGEILRFETFGYAGSAPAQDTSSARAAGEAGPAARPPLDRPAMVAKRTGPVLPRTSSPTSGAGAAGPSSGSPSNQRYDGAMTGSDEITGVRLTETVSALAPIEESERKLRELGYVSSDDRDEVLGRDLSAFDKRRQLDPLDRERWIEEECGRILSHCRRRPSEKPRDMFFRFYGDNSFEIAALDAQSTFSVDVDTASYALARRYLEEGNIPGKAQVRTEEFVNYFKADVPAPTKGTFAIHTDLAPSRFSSDKQRWMLRVVVRGREVAKVQRQPLNLTFVIDVSGSMREGNRLEMVKHAIRLLVNELGAGDNIALVAFSTDARTVLPMTSVRDRSAIEAALYPLQPENSTNSEAGLRLGYSTALASINPEANNRVVFLSDGVANVGETDPSKISETVKPIREKGVYLNTIGVGMNNHNDVLLEQLANKGDGICNYIDSPDEAKKVIVDGFTGAFETIARDVKVQVEFDPAQVERYRLLGYENRAIADKDFRNDKIDAGEVGAGHQVTALYELELGSAASEKPLATVHLRWKAPRSVAAPTANEEATEIVEPVLASRKTSFEGAGAGYRRAVIVAQFAEFLRRSVHARGDSLDDLIVEATKLEKESSDPEIVQFVALLRRSKELILRALPDCDDLCQTIEAMRRNALLRCERSLLLKEEDQKKLSDLGYLSDLEKENADLEQRIKELLRRKLEQQAK